MRVLLLSDTYSEHTEKWALGLASQGVEVGLFSFNKASYAWYDQKDRITVLYEPLEKAHTSGLLNKFSYLKYVLPLKKAIKKFKPDVLHAHYATSYGLVGALSGFKPYVISAWGTDVMKFPQKGFINKSILSYNLRSAQAICATSHTIEEYLKPVTTKNIDVIPFGVDVNVFCFKTVNKIFDTDAFVIGCIKALEKLYNIDVLMQAFHQLKQKYPTRSLKLLIIGEGSEKQNLEQQAQALDLQQDVVFTGRIAFNEVANYFNQIDVLANISDYESFGVSVIEAMACEKPVIATNTGGLKEIIENSTFGSLVEVGNVEQTTHEMEKYLLDSVLKERVGKAAREKVIEKYNWTNNIKQMIDVYSQLTKK